MARDGGGRDSLVVSGEIIVDKPSQEPKRPPRSVQDAVPADSHDATHEWNVPPPPVWGSSESGQGKIVEAGQKPEVLYMATATDSDELGFAPRRGRPHLYVVGLVAVILLAIGGYSWRSQSEAPNSGPRPAPADPVVPEPPPQAPPASAAAPTDACPPGMVLLDAGSFRMGSNENGRLRARAPVRRADVESFCISTHEITLAEYRTCSKIGECKRAFRDSDRIATGIATPDDLDSTDEIDSQLCNENYQDRDDHPVNCVTWHQARRFCEWKGWRLPTEVEWEYAARGPEPRRYPWGEELPSIEHLNACGSECMRWRAEHELPTAPTRFAEDEHIGTAPIGTFTSGTTPTGITDLAGNVAEWTVDVYELGRGRDGTQGRKRVIRGGSFTSRNAVEVHPAYRVGLNENIHAHDVGFRCAVAPRQSA